MNTKYIVQDFIDNKGDENYLESLYAEEKIKNGYEQKKHLKTDGVLFKDGSEFGIMECKRGKAVSYTQQNKITILCQLWGYLYIRFNNANNIPKGYILEISTDKYNSFIRMSEQLKSYYAKFKKMYSKYYDRDAKRITPSKIWNSKECIEIKEFMLSLMDKISFKTYNTGEIDYDDFTNELYRKHLNYA